MYSMNKAVFSSKRKFKNSSIMYSNPTQILICLVELKIFLILRSLFCKMMTSMMKSTTFL